MHISIYNFWKALTIDVAARRWPGPQSRGEGERGAEGGGAVMVDPLDYIISYHRLLILCYIIYIYIYIYICIHIYIYIR